MGSLKISFSTCATITLVLSLTFSFVPTVSATGYLAQVWGQRYSSAGYWGVDSYITTPNPSVSSGNWADGLAAISQLTATGAFIEAGPTKNCPQVIVVGILSAHGVIFTEA